MYAYILTFLGFGGFFFRESDNSIRASDFQDLLARQGKQVLKFMSVPAMMLTLSMLRLLSSKALGHIFFRKTI